MPFSSSRATSYLVLALSLFTVFTACEASDPMDTNQATFEAAMQGLTHQFDRAEVEAFIGVPFPDTATDVNTAGESALDTMVIAHFELPGEDLDLYLRELGITESLTPGNTVFFPDAPFRDAEAWWQVPEFGTTAAEYRSVYQRIDMKSYKILVEEHDAGVVAVTIQVFNT